MSPTLAQVPASLTHLHTTAYAVSSLPSQGQHDRAGTRTRVETSSKRANSRRLTSEGTDKFPFGPSRMHINDGKIWNNRNKPLLFPAFSIRPATASRDSGGVWCAAPPPLSCCPHCCLFSDLAGLLGRCGRGHGTGKSDRRWTNGISACRDVCDDTKKVSRRRRHVVGGVRYQDGLRSVRTQGMLILGVSEICVGQAGQGREGPQGVVPGGPGVWVEGPQGSRACHLHRRGGRDVLARWAGRRACWWMRVS